MHGNSLVGRGVVDPEAGKGRLRVQNQPLTWGDVELRELVTGIEPALSAWETDPAVRREPGEPGTIVLSCR